MRIGIKYCGGCNPRYDRTALVSRLKQALEGECVQWVSASVTGEPFDFVLVVCGCTAACAQHEELNGISGKLVIDSRSEFSDVLEQLLKLKNNV